MTSTESLPTVIPLEAPLTVKTNLEFLDAVSMLVAGEVLGFNVDTALSHSAVKRKAIVDTLLEVHLARISPEAELWKDEHKGRFSDLTKLVIGMAFVTNNGSMAAYNPGPTSYRLRKIEVKEPTLCVVETVNTRTTQKFTSHLAPGTGAVIGHNLGLAKAASEGLDLSRAPRTSANLALPSHHTTTVVGTQSLRRK